MLTNLDAWASEVVMRSVDYIGQRMRFVPYVDARTVADGVTEKFSIPAAGGTHSPADSVVDLPAPTSKRAGTIELNPTTRLASETVELTDAEMSRVVGGASRSLPLLLTGQLDSMASALDNAVYEGARDLAGGYAQVNDLPAAPGNAFGASGDNLLALRNLYTQFQRQNVDPETVDLRVVVSDDSFRRLLGYPNIIQAQVRGDSQASRTGRVLGVLGFNTILGSNRVDSANRTGTANRAVNNPGGYPIGYRGPITFDGGGGVAPAAGDVIRFGTTDQDAYIVESVTGATMQLTRQLSKALSDNDVIQPLADNRATVGLAFSRRSIGFATRMLPTGNSGSIVRTAAQAADGSVSLRLTVQQRAWGIWAAFDITHGLVVLSPQEMCQFGSSV